MRGNGENRATPLPTKVNEGEKRNSVMRGQGYSLREIMKAMGYKSVRSVAVLLLPKPRIVTRQELIDNGTIPKPEKP